MCTGNLVSASREDAPMIQWAPPVVIILHYVQSRLADFVKSLYITGVGEFHYDRSWVEADEYDRATRVLRAGQPGR